MADDVTSDGDLECLIAIVVDVCWMLVIGIMMAMKLKQTVAGFFLSLLW